MNKLKAVLKVLSKRKTVTLIVTAVAAILVPFGIGFSETDQVQVIDLVLALSGVLGIILGVNFSEKEVKQEVEKAKQDKEAE